LRFQCSLRFSQFPCDALKHQVALALAWRRDGVVTEWNPTFAGMALDLGLGIEVCWP